MPHKLASALGLALVTLSLGCGAEGSADLDALAPGVSGEAIINGETCDAHESSTAVAILVDALVSLGDFGELPIKTVVCTGTLIAPDVVLAAAHCLDASASTFGFGEVQSERYFITFDEDLSGLAEQTVTEFPEGAIEATSWVTHENFALDSMTAENVNGPGNFYDVGLLFLEEAVTDVVPEVVITPAEAEGAIVQGADVIIAGWGQQVQTSGPLEAPPAGTVGVKRCGLSFINEVGEHEMQVGGDATTTRKCHGDSGGPTFLTLEDTSHVRARRVVGITSHAYDAEDCNKGGVDTRVDAFFDWIDGRMSEACQAQERAWCDVEGVIPASYYDPEGHQPDDDEDKKNVDEITPPPPALCRCVAGDSETAPPSLALAALLALAWTGRRRRR